jgi:hypothetical protein
MQVNYIVTGTPTDEATRTRRDRLSARVVNLSVLSGGGTVVASATSLLACPFAGHHCSVHTTTYRTKTGQAGESFGTVSL